MLLNKKTTKAVFKIALPAVGEMILYMMIWVFDTMMVGQYGGNIAVSSVGLSSEIMYSFSNIFIAIGVSVGITSLVARKYGAKEYDLAEEYATLGFLIGAIISLIFFFILFSMNKKILTLVGADSSVVSLGSTYTKLASIGIFFNMLMNMLNALLRGYGNTKTPLMASILVNMINIPLDYVLIFGKFNFPELGVAGAAIATTIAQISGFIFIALYVALKSKLKLRLKYIKDFNLTMIKDFSRLFIPSSMQEAAFSIGRLLSNFMIVSMGTIAFAANQITTTIESISFMPGSGFAVAATALVGHKIGEKKIKEAKEYAYTSIILGTALMFICSLLFLSFPRGLIGLFINQSEYSVIQLGALCLMVASIEQPFMGISMIAGGALKGAGNTKTPFIISLISSWCIRLPLMVYIIYVLKLSVVWVWVITSLQWLFDGTLIFILFKKYFRHLK